MDRADVEGIAADLLRRGGFEIDDAPSMPRLAQRLLGAGAVVRTPAAISRTKASLCIVAGSPVIHVRGRLAVHEERFLIAHELAEWALLREDYRGEDIEDAADAIGASLVAPRRAFASFAREVGARFDALAEAFTATESLAALRYGETMGEPLALVTPASVRVRGPESWAWPGEEEIRRVARAGRPGLRRCKLRDDPRRVVVRAEVG